LDNSNRRYIRRQTFPEMFDNSVFRFGDRRCQWWKTDDGSTASLTYAEVGRIVREISGGLMSLEVGMQDRVAIMSANCPQWLWADLAILSAGLVTVALYPTLSQREMAALINDSGSKVLFVQSQENLQKAINLWDEMPTLEKVVVLQGDPPDDPRVIGLNQLRDEGSFFLARHPFAHDRWRSVNLYDPMTIIYTSGTTGNQKGAVHTHYSMNAAMGLVLKTMPPISEEDVFLSLLPLSHSYERQCGQMTALTVGATIAYAEKPATFLGDLRIFEPTVFMATPRYFEMIYNAIRELFSTTPEDSEAFKQALQIGLQVVQARSDDHGFIDMSEGVDLTSNLSPELMQQFLEAERQIFQKARALLGKRYRFAFSAAGGLPAKLCRILMAMGIRVIEGYGLIETCNTVTLNCLRRILPGSVGPLATGVEGRLSEDGELLVRGDSIIKEYWNNPTATAEAFTPDGFFRTGDIVEQAADGYIRIIDRKKGLLILSSGENIPAAKLENAFFLNPYIEQICVLGDDRPYVTALVVPRFERFVEQFRQEGIQFDESALQYESSDRGEALIKVGPDFVAHESLRSVIDREIAKVNRTLEDYEAIQKYIIINRRFAGIAGEVTPTLKLKRKVIYQNFADEIDKLYQNAQVGEG